MKLHDVTRIQAADSVQASQTKGQLRWNYLVFDFKKSLSHCYVCTCMESFVTGTAWFTWTLLFYILIFTQQHFTRAFPSCILRDYVTLRRCLGGPNTTSTQIPKCCHDSHELHTHFTFYSIYVFCNYIFVIVRLLKEWFSGHISFSQAMVFYIHSRNCWILITRREQVNVFKLYHLMSKIKSPIFGENFPRILILVGYKLQFW